MVIDGNDTTRVNGFNQYVEVQRQNFQKYKNSIVDGFAAYKERVENPPEDDGYDRIQQKEAAKAQKAVAKEMNEKYAEAMRDSKNWIEVKASDPIKPEKTEGMPKLTDAITGLSEKAKVYLDNDEQFSAHEKQMTEYTIHLMEQKSVLNDKKTDYLAAKEKFESIPYSDYDAKKAAQDELYSARNDYESVMRDIHGTEKDMDELTEKVMSYARIVNSWQDGGTVVLKRQETGKSFVNKEFETVTLSNGLHAYKSDGQYYAMGEDGLPDLNKTLSL